ncbi:MAG: RelA/SpoT family protein [Deltaproteobacteria bacterium]|jgi:guanosine-3',5'-bis(diphosphate) 3'-pyrophosphohydrolase|nr:RelA/SpoT family protein [Deltaproteobacteria bacterium]
MIQPDISDILETVKANFSHKANLEYLKKSYELAVEVHREDRRLSGEPYIVHPVAVARIAAQMGLGTNIIATAFLHDIGADNLNEKQELLEPLTEFFVERMVALRRIKPGKITAKEREGYRRLVLAESGDLRVTLLRIADRLDNIRTVDSLELVKQKQLAREIRYIYTPLANRLGLQAIKSEFKNRCFAILEPHHYQKIEKQVENFEKMRKAYVDEVTRLLNDIMKKENISPLIYGRSKHLYSIFLKMKQKDLSIEDIHDIIGFRVITESESECYTALGAIHGRWKPVEGRFKDYIAVPKDNGYQSLHTSVIGPGEKRIEIQIRTRQMHQIAEKGVAAHWLYKERFRKGVIHGQAFRILRNTTENLKKKSVKFREKEYWSLENFQDEIFVFTPQGQLVVLPRGASALDFAFAIHSQVGSTCTGTKVNGIMVPIKHKLETWNQVEIITSKNQTPSSDWLEMVVTSKAKSKIRHHIHTQQRKRARKLGEELVEKLCKKHSLSFSRLRKDGQFEKATRKLKYKDEKELFLAVGNRKCSTRNLLEQLAPDLVKKLESGTAKKKQKKSTSLKKSSHGQIEIDGLMNVLFKYARCCKPVFGDSIIGYITRGRGVTIHRKGCPRLEGLNKNRIINVDWVVDSIEGRILVLKVVSDNKPGLLAQMSNIFAKKSKNIEKITTRQLQSNRVSTLIHFTSESKDIDSLLKNLKKIKGVYSVSREDGF